MTVTALPTSAPRARPSSAEIVANGIRRRYAAERRFKMYGIAAVLFGLTFLVILFSSIISKGYTLSCSRPSASRCFSIPRSSIRRASGRRTRC
jgi:hypothetical protein